MTHAITCGMFDDVNEPGELDIISRSGWTIAAGGQLEWRIEIAHKATAFFGRLVTATIPNDDVGYSDWLGPFATALEAGDHAHRALLEMTDRPYDEYAGFPDEHEMAGDQFAHQHGT